MLLGNESSYIYGVHLFKYVTKIKHKNHRPKAKVFMKMNKSSVSKILLDIMKEMNCITAAVKCDRKNRIL